MPRSERTSKDRHRRHEVKKGDRSVKKRERPESDRERERDKENKVRRKEKVKEKVKERDREEEILKEHNYKDRDSEARNRESSRDKGENDEKNRKNKGGPYVNPNTIPLPANGKRTLIGDPLPEDDISPQEDSDAIPVKLDKSSVQSFGSLGIPLSSIMLPPPNCPPPEYPGPPGSRRRKQGNKTEGLDCHICHMTGHSSRECPRKGRKSPSRKVEDEDSYAIPLQEMNQPRKGRELVIDDNASDSVLCVSDIPSYPHRLENDSLPPPPPPPRQFMPKPGNFVPTPPSHPPPPKSTPTTYTSNPKSPTELDPALIAAFLGPVRNNPLPLGVPSQFGGLLGTQNPLQMLTNPALLTPQLAGVRGLGLTIPEPNYRPPQPPTNQPRPPPPPPPTDPPSKSRTVLVNSADPDEIYYSSAEASSKRDNEEAIVKRSNAEVSSKKPKLNDEDYFDAFMAAAPSKPTPPPPRKPAKDKREVVYDYPTKSKSSKVSDNHLDDAFASADLNKPHSKKSKTTDPKQAYLESLLPPRTENWNTEMYEEYKSSLEDDLSPSASEKKFVIANLTTIAKENKQFYAEIITAIITRLVQTDENNKIDIWHLIDSICKRIGGRYLTAFQNKLLDLVSTQMPKSDPKIKNKYVKLIDTWVKVFPSIIADVRASFNHGEEADSESQAAPE